MVLVVFSQPNKDRKFFNSKLYKIRVRALDFLFQNTEPFTTPTHAAPESVGIGGDVSMANLMPPKRQPKTVDGDGRVRASC